MQKKPNYKYYSYTSLGAGATLVIDTHANFLAMLSNSSATSVKVQIDGDVEQDLPAGLSLEFEKEFDQIRFRNPTAGTIAITFAVALGKILDNRLTLSSSTLNINTAANTIQTIAQITSTGTAVAKSPPGGTQETIIQNTGNSPCWIGDASVSTTQGYYLDAGQTVILSSLADWYVIDDGANHTTLNVVYLMQI